jgi:hypothetical protein
MYFDTEREEMSDGTREDTTTSVQIEEIKRDILEQLFVTNLSPVHAHNGHGDVLIAKSMTTVERNKSHQFKSPAGIPRNSHASRSCYNDCRIVMSIALKLVLKQLPLMTKQQLL